MTLSETILRDIQSTIKEDHPVSDIQACVFWTAVISLRCGLASTMAVTLPPGHGHQVENAGGLLPSGAAALTALAFSSRVVEAAIGLAAMNSILPFTARG